MSRPEGDERRAQSPQSVTRVIRLLEALCASPEPMSLADLSRALDTPKSSLAALLRGLAEEHFVVSTDGAWRLGPGAFGLGSALIEARRRVQSSDLVREGMRRLAEASGETVLLGIADGDGATFTYIDVVESRNSVRFSVTVGDRPTLYATAGGRMLLASRPQEEVERYLDALEPERFTAHTEVSRKGLAAAIAEARASGVAQTVDQAADGVTGTAAPIRSASGAVTGALILAAPTARAQGKLAELARLVRTEAEAISRNLGYRPAGKNRERNA